MYKEISRYLERKYFRRLRGRDTRICNSKRIFGRLKKEFGRGDDETIKVVESKKVE